jgi:CRP/FNR family transcriptional regulator, cyclic AMP receptor protein
VSEADFVGCIDTDARAALLAAGRRRECPSGQVLFFEGDEGREVLVLLEGNVKIVTSASTGREVILDVLDPGALLGELSAVDGQARSATAVALTRVVVLVVPVANFSSFLDEHAVAAKALLELIVGRLRRSSERQLEFGTSDALGRLCRCLLTMLDRYGGHDHDSLRVTTPLAQHEIAAMTGLSREAVVKGLRALRSLEWIEVHARDITILDEPAMRARARV